MTNIPQNIDQWLEELSRAYREALDTIPFGDFVGETISEDKLFHLSPHITIKYRCIKRNKTNIKIATEAALSTYVANQDRDDLPIDDPLIIFSVCYLASHYGLGLLSSEEADRILLQVEKRRDELSKLILKDQADKKD